MQRRYRERAQIETRRLWCMKARNFETGLPVLCTWFMTHALLITHTLFSSSCDVNVYMHGHVILSLFVVCVFYTRDALESAPMKYAPACACCYHFIIRAGLGRIFARPPLILTAFIDPMSPA